MQASDRDTVHTQKVDKLGNLYFAYSLLTRFAHAVLPYANLKTTVNQAATYPQTTTTSTTTTTTFTTTFTTTTSTTFSNENVHYLHMN